MDILVRRDAILKPLQALSSIVEKKQAQPILSNVLLTIQDGKLLLTGTDHEIELVGFVPIEQLTRAGTTTVSARKLFDICRTLPEDTSLSLTLGEKYLIARAHGSHFKLNILPPEDFPALESNTYHTTLTLKQSHIKHLLTKTYFAMAQQDVRHYLNGALLEISPRTLKCVAADGHRLALATIADEGIGDLQASVILPRKSVLELTRLLAHDTDTEAELALSEHRFRITTPDFIFTSKLINAQYPDYHRLIPKGTSLVVAEREAVKDALTRASILSTEKFRGVRFQLEPQKLTITANNADHEHAEDAVAVNYADNAMELGFNVTYLLDVVSSMTSSTLRCLLGGPNEAMLMEPGDEDGSLYVVMPMRL